MQLTLCGCWTRCFESAFPRSKKEEPSGMSFPPSKKEEPSGNDFSEEKCQTSQLLA